MSLALNGIPRLAEQCAARAFKQSRTAPNGTARILWRVRDRMRQKVWLAFPLEQREAALTLADNVFQARVSQLANGGGA